MRYWISGLLHCSDSPTERVRILVWLGIWSAKWRAPRSAGVREQTAPSQGQRRRSQSTIALKRELFRAPACDPAELLP